MDYATREFAKELLLSGKDRIPRVQDRRHLRTMRHWGLLQYPDGYSLTTGGMQAAVDFWEMALRDAEEHQTPAVPRLQKLVALGNEWIRHHHRHPDLQKLRFGDLSFDQYHVLWEIVTDRPKAVAIYAKKFWGSLVKKGYLERANLRDEPDPDGPMLQATDKGRKMVVDTGDPYWSQRMAANVLARYLEKK